jgi:hypothetical protein
LTLALREGKGWRYIGHVGTGFNRETLKELHGKLIKLKTAKSPFATKVKDEAVITWVKPSSWPRSSSSGRAPAKCGIRYISGSVRTNRPKMLRASSRSRERDE